MAQIPNQSPEDICCNMLQTLFHSNIDRIDEILPLIIGRGSTINPDFYFSE
jgi:hypothetical protein